MFEILRNVKIIKAPADYRFIVIALSHCAMLSGNNFGKENIYEITFYFIFYFYRKYRYVTI